MLNAFHALPKFVDFVTLQTFAARVVIVLTIHLIFETANFQVFARIPVVSFEVADCFALRALVAELDRSVTKVGH